MHLDFESALDWRVVKNNSGPHIQRLPDELLAAIEKFLLKFLIIESDNCNDDEKLLYPEKIDELTLLLKCLIIICRNFDNIKAIIKSTCFISNSIAISNKLIDSLFEEESSDDQTLIQSKISFIKTASKFLESIFDPVLCWRNYLKNSLVDFGKLDYSVTVPTLNVEIVPFIYDYFQLKNYHQYSEISISLINLLGAIIAGSQVSLNSRD